MSIAGTFVFVAALVVAMVIAWQRGRKSPLQREIRARPLLDPDAAPGGATNSRLDPQLTRDVLRALGAALDIAPGQLRLTDDLAALWDMDPQAGFHQRATFEAWLVKRFPRLPEITPAVTIADLVAALQRLPMVR